MINEFDIIPGAILTRNLVLAYNPVIIQSASRTTQHWFVFGIVEKRTNRKRVWHVDAMEFGGAKNGRLQRFSLTLMRFRDWDRVRL